MNRASLMRKKAEEPTIVVPHPSQSKLIGHQEMLGRLDGIMQMEKSHHAVMLAGRRGIGKATLLYESLKKHLVECDVKAGKGRDSVSMLLAGTHPDIFVLEASTSKANKEDISVDQVRAMIEFARLTPSYLDKKYIIIDPVDALNTSSANALLKILEEPPATVRFLMVCNGLYTTMSTIVSRCMVLHCRPSGPQDCMDILKSLGVEEELELVAKVSEYNVSTAIDIIKSDGLSFYRALLDDINSPYNTCEKAIAQMPDSVYYPDLLKYFVQRIHITLCKMSAGVINPLLVAEFEIDALEKYLNTKYSTPLEVHDKMAHCSQLLADSEIFNLGEVHLTQALLHLIRR